MTERCCYIGDDRRACGRAADFAIFEAGTTREGTTADDTYACTDHLGHLCGPAGEPVAGRSVHFRAYPLAADGQ